MNKQAKPVRPLGAANRDAGSAEPREDVLAWLAGFAELFVWLLLLKSYWLQLYIIPTGSMAETLAGEHGVHTCRNCGKEYEVGFTAPGPELVECPNCRDQEETALRGPNRPRIVSKAGDRIVVHGWPYEISRALGPQRWDVVVFKNPNEPNVNYIKRLIGLPGDTIEIIDGDIWVKSAGDAELQLARKTRTAQDALWMPVFEQDYVPRHSSSDRAVPAIDIDMENYVEISAGDWRLWKSYHPRWAQVGAAGSWRDTGARSPRFDGVQADRSEIQFVTSTDETQPGMIADTLGYNAHNRVRLSAQTQDARYPRAMHAVTDVRVGADVLIEAGDGYVELGISKYHEKFFARLYADGRITLEHAQRDGERVLWAEGRFVVPGRAVRFSIGHADYEVVVELDGKPVLCSPTDQYSREITARIARERRLLHEQGRPIFPTIRIAAERVRASLAHLRIDRDVFYTSDVSGNGPIHPTTRKPLGNGVMNSPITLRSDAYFVCGDNSTHSLDSRCWKTPPSPEAEDRLRRSADSNREQLLRELQGRLGPQLRDRYAAGQYDIGTVPADQMLGRAFLVYWPGFMPEVRIFGLNILPDLGRVRWIH